MKYLILALLIVSFNLFSWNSYKWFMLEPEEYIINLNQEMKDLDGDFCDISQCIENISPHQYILDAPKYIEGSITSQSTGENLLYYDHYRDKDVYGISWSVVEEIDGHFVPITGISDNVRIQINSNKELDWGNASGGRCINLNSVIKHELLHTTGIAHSANSNIMNGGSNGGFTPLHENHNIDDDNKQALRAIYNTPMIRSKNWPDNEE